MSGRAGMPRGYIDGGCEVCGSQWTHRLTFNALALMGGGKAPRWPKRRQAIQSCFECGHPVLLMQAVSRDVLEVRL